MGKRSFGSRVGLGSSLAVFATTVGLLWAAAPAALASYTQTTKCSGIALFGTTASCSYVERCPQTQSGGCLFFFQGHATANRSPSGVTGSVTFSVTSAGHHLQSGSCTSRGAFLLSGCTAEGEGFFARGESVTVTCTSTSASMMTQVIASCSDEEDL